MITDPITASSGHTRLPIFTIRHRPKTLSTSTGNHTTHPTICQPSDRVSRTSSFVWSSGR